MRQAIDVLAVFDIGANNPRPIRFRMFDRGIKTTFRVTEIRNVDWIRSGRITHIEYDCVTFDEVRQLRYKLLYFFEASRWEIKTD